MQVTEGVRLGQLPKTEELYEDNTIPVSKGDVTQKVPLKKLKEYVQEDTVSREDFDTEVKAREKGDTDTLEASKRYTDEAQLATQTWKRAVPSFADLPDPQTLSPKINYLCRVIGLGDGLSYGHPNGVYQLRAESPENPVREWDFFSDNQDWIDRAELEEALAVEAGIREGADQFLQDQIDALSPEGLDEMAKVLAGIPGELAKKADKEDLNKKADKEDLNTKAPVNHASTVTTYGIANGSTYGHVRFPTPSTTAAVPRSVIPFDYYYQTLPEGKTWNLNGWREEGETILYPGISATVANNWPAGWPTGEAGRAAVRVTPFYSDTVVGQELRKVATGEIFLRFSTSATAWSPWKPLTGRRAATRIVGHASSGYTLADVDYLCTGSNDQNVINNAINAGGGKIIILSGTYYLNAPIVVNKDNVTIEGMGGSTVLSGESYMSSSNGLINVTGSYCVITGLKTASVNPSSTAGAGIYVTGSNNTISGNIFSHANTTMEMTSYGVYVTGSNNTISGNTFGNSSTYDGLCYGVYLSGGNYNTVSGNTFTNQTTSYCYGVYVTGSRNTVSGNIFTNQTTSYCYGVYAGGSDHIISGNMFGNNSSNMSCSVYLGSGSTGVVVEGNIIANSFMSGSGKAYGVWLAGTCTRAVISNNHFANKGVSRDGRFTAFYIASTVTSSVLLGNNVRAAVVDGGMVYTNNGTSFSDAPPAGTAIAAGKFGSGNSNVCGFTLYEV
jgi:parallel beta-helix repeat protein